MPLSGNKDGLILHKLYNCLSIQHYLVPRETFVMIHLLLCLVDTSIHLINIGWTHKRHPRPFVNIVALGRNIVTNGSTNWFCSHFCVF